MYQGFIIFAFSRNHKYIRMETSKLMQQMQDYSENIARHDYHESDVLLFNTVTDKCMPSDFIGKYHIHILCNAGNAQFCFGERIFHIAKDSLVIWQMSSDIYDVLYSTDFDADFLLVSKDFLGQFNPEMIWAIKGFVFIKLNPVFSLTGKERALCDRDFEQFRMRLADNHIFRTEVLGRLLQIFLFDMWDIYSREIEHVKASDITARTFLRFQELVSRHCKQEREVAFYSDKLCITPKYLSEVCRKISNIPASEWISYYMRYELVKMLDDTNLTLVEISDSLAFTSTSHFSRYVKRLLGVSPSEYRQEAEKKKAEE